MSKIEGKRILVTGPAGQIECRRLSTLNLAPFGPDPMAFIA